MSIGGLGGGANTVNAKLNVLYGGGGIERAGKAMQDLARTGDKLRTTLGRAVGSGTFSPLIGESGRAVAALRSIETEATRLQTTLKSTGNSLVGAGRTLTGSAIPATASILGLTGSVGGLGAVAVRTAASFEQAMANVRAVTGVVGTQFTQLESLARKLGKTTVFSAIESAGAIEQLAKSGVSVKDILAGAAQGAVNLAAAAGTGVDTAAAVISNALNVFKLAGDQATHVADVFAAGANKSAADVDTLAQALAQAGNVAGQFGLGLEDAVGALALFAQNGLRGSDAGTSFRTMLLSMLTPTQQQADLMNQLGISFFDSEGRFIGLAGVADTLQKALSGLTDQQRETALATLFGADAVRAGAILYTAGAKGVNEYTAAVNDQGAAQRVAAARTKTFQGALERLHGAVQDFQIALGELLLPTLARVAGVLARAFDRLTDLPKPARLAIVAIAGIATVIGPLLLGFGAMALALNSIIGLLAGTAAAAGVAGAAMEGATVAASGGILAVAAPLAALIAAVTAFGIAYARNWAGVRDITNGAVGLVVREVGVLGRDLLALGRRIASPFTDAIASFRSFEASGHTAFRSLTHAIGTFLRGLNTGFAPLDRLFDRAAGAVRRFGAAIDRPLRLFLEGISKIHQGGDRLHKILNQLPTPLAKIVILLSRVVNTARAFFRTLSSKGPVAAFRELSRNIETIGRTLGNLFASLGFERFGAQIKTTFRDIGQTIRDVVALVSDLVHGRWDRVWRDLVRIGHDAVRLLVDRVKLLPALLGDIFDLIPWGAVGRLALAAFSALGGIVLRAVRGVDWADLGSKAWAFFTDAVTTAAQKAVEIGDIALDAVVGFAGDLLDAVTDFAGWLAPQLTRTGRGVFGIGRVALSAAVDLAGDLADVVRNFGAWLSPKLRHAGRAVFGIGTVALSAVVGLAGDLLDASKDLRSWLAGRLLQGAGAAGVAGVLLAAGALVIPIGVVSLVGTLVWGGGGGGAGTGAGMFDGVVSGIANGLAAALTGAAAIGAAVVSGIAGAITSVKNWQISAQTLFGVGVAIGSALFNVVSASATIVRGIVDGIASAVRGIDLAALRRVDWVDVATAIVKGIALAVALLVAAPAIIVAAIGIMIAGAIVGFAFGPDVTFGDVASAVVDGIAGAIRKAKDAGRGILQAIADAVSGATDFDWSATVSGVASNFLSSLLLAIGNFQGIGETILSTISNAVSAVASFDWSGTAASIASSLWDAVIQWFKDHVSLQDIADAIVGAANPLRRETIGRHQILDQHGNVVGTAADETTTVPPPSTEPFRQFVADVQAIVGRLPGILLNAVIDAQNRAVAQANALRNATANVFVGLRSDLAVLSASIRATIVNGFVGLRTDVAAVMASVVRIIAAYSVAAFASGFAVGASAGNGIVAGLISRLVAVRIAGAALGAAAVGGAAGPQGVDAASPSKKFMRLGDLSVQGYIDRLVAGIDRARAAGIALVSLVPPTIPAPMPATLRGAASAGVAASFAWHGDVRVDLAGAPSDPGFGERLGREIGDAVWERLTRAVDRKWVMGG